MPGVDAKTHVAAADTSGVACYLGVGWPERRNGLVDCVGNGGDPTCIMAGGCGLGGCRTHRGVIASSPKRRSSTSGRSSRVAFRLLGADHSLRRRIQQSRWRRERSCGLRFHSHLGIVHRTVCRIGVANSENAIRASTRNSRCSGRARGIRPRRIHQPHVGYRRLALIVGHLTTLSESDHVLRVDEPVSAVAAQPS